MNRPRVHAEKLNAGINNRKCSEDDRSLLRDPDQRFGVIGLLLATEGTFQIADS